jgi:hypothetical protein
MNLLGKIFVVGILVMSIMFMSMSVMVYATHKNWKGVVFNTQPPGLKPRLDEANVKLKNLQARLDALEKLIQTERDERNAQRGKIETQYAELKKVHDELVREQAGLKEGERRAAEAALVAQELLDSKLKENDQLRTEVAQARDERDVAFKGGVALADKLHESEGERSKMSASTLAMTRQNALYRDRAEKQGVDINAPADNVPPKLDGVVLAARANGLVEISLGSDDGLRKGHQAYIYRKQKGESKPVAKIEVVEVTPDKSVGKVIPEFRLGPIERDDRVATRLN